MQPLDTTDRRILDLIQRHFPLVARPFKLIAERAATTEADVIQRLARLKQAGLVREICAVFDAERLGYRSTLAAMAVEPTRLDEVAAIVSAHPGVSHNYERTHEFNLWFTLTVAAERSIEREIGRLVHDAQVVDFLILPAIRRFKIGVDFDLGTRGGEDGSGVWGMGYGVGEQELPLRTQHSGLSNQDSTIRDQGSGISSSRSEIQNPKSKIENRKSKIASGREGNVVRVLQYDFPLEPRPFERLAGGIGMHEEELLAITKRFLATGTMRRIGAILHHRHVGYLANAMVCWALPADRIEQAGQKAARERAISHCYQRPAFPPRWPYNLMTMIHGRSEEQVREVVGRLRSKLQPIDCAILFSRREFKKQRVHYFEEK